jgi:hypothetical protein
MHKQNFMNIDSRILKLLRSETNNNCAQSPDFIWKHCYLNSSVLLHMQDYMLGTRLGCIWAKLAMSKRGPSKAGGAAYKAAALATFGDRTDRLAKAANSGGSDLEPGWILVDLLLHPFSSFTCSRSF